MRGFVRGLVLLLCLTLAVPPAIAREFAHQKTVGPNDKVGESLVGWQESANKWQLVRSGPNGELFVTELNPDAYQFTPQTIVAIALTAAQANTSNPATGASLTPFPASIHAHTMVRITTSSFSNAAIPWSVRWWGSVDGVTYIPITKGTNALAAGATKAVGFVYGPSIAIDTLKVFGHGNTSTGWFVLKDALGSPITMKNIVAVASIDSAAGTGTVTIECAGRQR